MIASEYANASRKHSRSAEKEVGFRAILETNVPDVVTTVL